MITVMRKGNSLSECRKEVNKDTLVFAAKSSPLNVDCRRILCKLKEKKILKNKKDHTKY